MHEGETCPSYVRQFHNSESSTAEWSHRCKSCLWLDQILIMLWLFLRRLFVEKMRWTCKVSCCWCCLIIGRKPIMQKLFCIICLGSKMTLLTDLVFSSKEVMFSLLCISLFVKRIMQKVFTWFPRNLVVLWSTVMGRTCETLHRLSVIFNFCYNMLQVDHMHMDAPPSERQ